MLRQIQKDIFDNTTSPVIKYRLALLLKENISKECFEEFYDSKWVRLLRANQNIDGGYGRFHSQDSKMNQKYATTEKAISSMNILGLGRGNELVDNLCTYMEGILNDEIEWPDGYEKNKWYRSAQPIFVISKLSNFASYNETYLKYCEIWIEILSKSFSYKTYDLHVANALSEKFIGCPIHGSYIGLNSEYLIELLSNLSAYIDKSIEEKYLMWLKSDNVTTHYFNVRLGDITNENINSVYGIVFHLSKFKSFKDIYSNEIALLKKKYCLNDCWNFGRNFNVQKLSDSWRNEKTKILDHTILAWMAEL